MTAYSSFLKNTFLFKGMTEGDISELISGIEFEEKSFSRDELIFSPDGFERRIGIVMKGECLVGRPSGGGFVPLNTMGVYESFGILSVFSAREDFPTQIKAKGACTVLFFPAASVRNLVEKSPAVSLNVIEFFARKVSFLNDKITAFSGGSVEEKLVGYILELQKKNGTLEFDFNKKKGAEALNCGRASLYRALAMLEADGLISLESKKIIINDLTGLERILK